MTNGFGRGVLLASSAIACMAASPALAQTRTFDIPAQPASTAISALGQQADIQVVSARRATEGKMANAVRGTMTVQEALSALLRGTGLAARQNGPHTYTIMEALRPGEPDAAGDAPEAAAEPSLLEEIIVTAQKRAEPLREVPISISAVTGERLERFGASRFSDFAGYVPGLTFSTTGVGGDGRFNLRGVSAGVGPSAATAVYVDDVPTTTHGAWGGSGGRAINLFPYDLDRVEVLRGPQGTLYGDSTIGGLVKYVTRPADVNDFSGAIGVEGVDMSGGEGQGGSFRAMVNAPIAPGLFGVRLSGMVRSTPGWATNVFDGEKGVNALEERGLRLAARLTPSDALSIEAQWLHAEYEVDGRDNTQLVSGTTRPLYGDHRYSFQVNQPTTQDFDLVSGTVRYDAGPVSLTSVTGYSIADRTNVEDYTGVARTWIRTMTGNAITNGRGALVAPSTNKKFTQELRLASADDQRLTWLAGAYYSVEDTDTYNRVIPYAGDGKTVLTSLLELSREDVAARYKDFSVFGNATFKITDKWEVSGGLRQSWTSEDFHDRLVGTFQNGSTTVPDIDNLSTETGGTTWSLTTRYVASDDLMMFARAATGFRAGGANYTWPDVPKGYEPDSLASYEAGIRADFFDDRASIDLVVYYLDWKDLFILAFAPDGSAYQTNGGRAKGPGLEFTGTVRPVRGLTLTATAAYFGLKAAEDVPELGALKGDRTPTSPAWSGSLLANYTMPIWGDWDLSLGGGVRMAGHTWSRFIHDPLARRMDSYAVVDLNAAVSNDRWTLRGYVNNLADDNTIVSYRTTTRVVQMQPRTIGLAIDMRF